MPILMLCQRFAVALVLLLSCVLMTDVAASAAPGGFETIYRFKSTAADSAGPDGGLTIADGSVCGSNSCTCRGGFCNCGGGTGIVYCLAPPAPGNSTWTFKKIHDFTGASLDNPKGALTASGHAIFGTATGSGGSVYSLTKGAGGFSYKVLHEFKNFHDGSGPNHGVVVAGDGTIYGTAASGGDQAGPGDGTFFKIDPSGRFSVVFPFGSGQGQLPNGELVLASARSVFGATADGKIYRVPASGEVFVAHKFKGQTPGGCHSFLPTLSGRMALGNDGSLYGTAVNENAPGAIAWVLKPVPGKVAAYSQIYRFPNVNVCPGVVTDGTNLYGVAYGGIYGAGILYRLSPPATGGTWTLTTLHAFAHRDPGGTLPIDVIFSDGVLYGTTYLGGIIGQGGVGFGTVFKYTLP